MREKRRSTATATNIEDPDKGNGVKRYDRRIHESSREKKENKNKKQAKRKRQTHEESATDEKNQKKKIVFVFVSVFVSVFVLRALSLLF